MQNARGAIFDEILSLSARLIRKTLQSPIKVVASLCSTSAKNIPLCRTRDVFAKQAAVARSKSPNQWRVCNACSCVCVAFLRARVPRSKLFQREISLPSNEIVALLGPTAGFGKEVAGWCFGWPDTCGAPFAIPSPPPTCRLDAA